MLHGMMRSITLLLFCLLLATLSGCEATNSTGAPTALPDAVAPTDTPIDQPTLVSASTSQQPSEATQVLTATVRTFQIEQSQSEARFLIDEMLMGSPKTVVGVTTLVSGAINVNLNDISQSTVGVIQIDASDFRTDDNMRNRAIRRFVLQSSREEYRYITFTPTTITGLPAQAQVGDAFSFQVMGDLKIREIVNSVTFTVNVTVDSETQLNGLAKTTITRTAFALNIPSVPGVANVADEVPLELQFVAVAP
jgi:polyisoprenoid-binding protein YceI